ncbi:hypothetical protein C8Q80DRAFT_938444 [Daedaleopsis nitida]|nr:hypothetical protein C8Q80DRAFT_938444 [Daedaleopsis nitida]
MGLGRVLAAAAAAAAAPVVRNYLHRRSPSDDSDGTTIPSRPFPLPTTSSLTVDPGSLLAEDMARRPLLADTQSSSRQSSAHGYNQNYGPPPGTVRSLAKGPRPCARVRRGTGEIAGLTASRRRPPQTTRSETMMNGTWQNRGTMPHAGLDCRSIERAVCPPSAR